MAPSGRGDGLEKGRWGPASVPPSPAGPRDPAPPGLQPGVPIGTETPSAVFSSKLRGAGTLNVSHTHRQGQVRGTSQAGKGLEEEGRVRERWGDPDLRLPHSL